MANKNLFKSLVGLLIPATDAVNSEQAPAYSFTPKHALAQYAATGCMNSTFYAGGAEQLAKVLELCASAEPAFVAKLAVYAREQGHMKDVPALLLAVLSVRDRALFARTFPRVCDNAKMLHVRADPSFCAWAASRSDSCRSAWCAVARPLRRRKVVQSSSGGTASLSDCEDGSTHARDAAGALTATRLSGRDRPRCSCTASAATTSVKARRELRCARCRSNSPAGSWRREVG